MLDTGSEGIFVKSQRQIDLIRDYFQTLYRAWGRQHWWPADSRFEVIVGAFLTQNTAWTNVELAMGGLSSAGLLSLKGVREVPLAQLEQLIRPAGYFRQKASRLKNFVAYLDEKYEGSLEKMFERPTSELRTELLELNGIGPETADSILLYAGNHEVFVVDAYTRRILDRHKILPETAKYEEIRVLFERALTAKFASEMSNLPASHELPKPAGAHHPPSKMSSEKRSARAQLFNEMHGLIVGVGKNYCQSGRVQCESCPLGKFLERPVKVKAKK
jgi:endonuclease-3 related protein